MAKKKDDLKPNTQLEVKTRYSRGNKPDTKIMTKSLFDQYKEGTIAKILEVQILINFQN